MRKIASCKVIENVTVEPKNRNHATVRYLKLTLSHVCQCTAVYCHVHTFVCPFHRTLQQMPGF